MNRKQALARLAAAVALALLTAASPTFGQVQISTTLEDYPPVLEFPGVDFWLIHYELATPFELGIGAALSIELPEGPAFESPFRFGNPGAGWTRSFFSADPSLGAAALLDLVASSESASELPSSISLVLPDGEGAVSSSQPYRVYDANFDLIESGTIQVPEPGAATSRLAALAALLVPAALRRRRPARRDARDGETTQCGSLTRQLALGLSIAAALAPTPAARAVEIESPTVHTEELADLEIEWVAVANSRKSETEWEYHFAVTVTNAGASSAPMMLKTWTEASLSPITSDDLALPALMSGETYSVPEPLVILQDRQLPLFPEKVHWCIASDPPQGLPASDPAVAAVDAHIAELAIDKKQSLWRFSVPIPFLTDAFDCARTYVWVLQTNMGTLEIELYHDVAPQHVSTTMFLTRLGFYDGLTFHRVIPDFVAQGGDPLGTGGGGPDGAYGSEFHDSVHHHRRGFLSMAHAGEGTDGSQFFLLFSPQYGLDNVHTVFGEAFGDLSALDAMEAVGTPGGTPTQPIIIESATIRVD